MANPNRILELREELTEARERLEAIETVLDRIHYTTPGLRHVLSAGGADMGDISELVKLLNLPME